MQMLKSIVYLLALTLHGMMAGDGPSMIELFPKTKSSFFDDRIVVEAKVVSVEGEKSHEKCAVKITKVYCGSKDLVGTTFSDYNAPLHMSRFGAIPLLVGETGIWTLVKGEHGLQPAEAPGFRVNRIRKHMESYYVDYSQYLQLADEIGRIYRLKPEERVQQVKGAVYSDVPTIAYWAANILPYFFDGKEAVRVMREVRKTPLKTVGATLAVDKFLYDWDPEAWIPSKERLEDLQRCVRLKMTPWEGHDLLNDLWLEIDGDLVDHKTAVQLLESARDNSTIDDERRERFGEFLEEYLAKSKGREKEERP